VQRKPVTTVDERIEPDFDTRRERTMRNWNW